MITLKYITIIIAIIFASLIIAFMIAAFTMSGNEERRERRNMAYERCKILEYECDLMSQFMFTECHRESQLKDKNMTADEIRKMFEDTATKAVKEDSISDSIQVTKNN